MENQPGRIEHGKFETTGQIFYLHVWMPLFSLATSSPCMVDWTKIRTSAVFIELMFHKS